MNADLTEPEESTDYDAMAYRMQHEADEAMGIFLKTLPDESRRLLLGVEQSHDRTKQVGLTKDISDSPAASYRIDVAAEVDDLADELSEQFRFLRRAESESLALFVESKVSEESERYNTWLLTRVTARLVEAGNAKIVAVSIAFAISVPQVWVNGVLCKTQIHAAEVLGTSRANLSKEVNNSKEWLGIDKGIHLKPAKAIESFRASQSMDHWRKRLYGDR